MLSLPFMQNALMAGFLIALLCPIIGIFLVLRRFSMIGDTLAHSSFAGVAIGLVIGIHPTITSVIFTTLAAVMIEYMRDSFKRYSEILMSVVMTLSVGIAIILVSSGSASASITQYLFGSILTVTGDDLILVLAVTIASALLVARFYYELIYSTFDEDGAKVSGIRVKTVNYIFALLMGASISASIRITGILVISSLIVLPVASAMQFRKGFTRTLAIAIAVSIVDVLAGLVLSYYLDSAPGGAIAIMSVITMVISLVMNPMGK
jgi:zinc transport system permease protein